MSLVTANGIGVISGTIIRPLVGVWTADLTIDQIDVTGFEDGKAVTVLAADGYSLSGTVVKGQSGAFIDTVDVLIAGGAAGMGTIATPRGFAKPSSYVRDVVNALAADAGQKVSSSISQDFMNTSLEAWTTKAEPVSRALTGLLDEIAPNMSWRILADGTLWVGPETWPSVTNTTIVLLEHDTSNAYYEFGVDSPVLEPGINLADVGHVCRVEDHISKADIRSDVYVTVTDEDRGLASSVAQIAQNALSGVDFFALIPAKVVSQSADFATVDVSIIPPLDKKYPGLSRVEVRTGSGIKIQFTPGASVLLGWKNGNPSLPYVCLGIGADTPQKLQLAGTHPAPLWDTFLADFKVFITDLKADLTAGSGGGCTTTSADYFTPKLVTGSTYKSTIVSNG